MPFRTAHGDGPRPPREPGIWWPVPRRRRGPRTWDPRLRRYCPRCYSPRLACQPRRATCRDCGWAGGHDDTLLGWEVAAGARRLAARR